MGGSKAAGKKPNSSANQLDYSGTQNQMIWFWVRGDKMLDDQSGWEDLLSELVQKNVSNQMFDKELLQKTENVFRMQVQ